MHEKDDIIVGIDLGTTFSLVAFCDERGPHVVRDENADARVPSVIAFAPDGRATIGWEARRHAVERPETTIFSIKRLMGVGPEVLARERPYLTYRVDAAERDVVRVDLNGRRLTPQEISALILRDLRGRAERALGRPVRRAVITVPAYFDDAQRQATRDAGRIAGLEVVRIINEPTAAALAYGLGRRTDAPGPRPAALPVGGPARCASHAPDASHDETRSVSERPSDEPRTASALHDETRSVSERPSDEPPSAVALHNETRSVSERPSDEPRTAVALHNETRSVSERPSHEPPSAVALHHETRSVSERNRPACIAVYDLGGGTFDVTILRLSDGVFEAVSTHGDTHLGGDDFDRTLIDLAQREIAERFALNIDAPATRQSLRLLAEQIKIRLSSESSASFELDLGGGRVYSRTITRDEFDRLIAPLVERTVIACCRALADAGLQTDQIDQVVLVGGSTRIPLVRHRVEQFFGRAPYTALNPDEVVALGAAVQGQILAGGRRDLLLLDVTPLSLGIETFGGAMGKLILRNTRIPCQATEMFTTFVDGQTSVKFRVLQGERELSKDCRALGEFELRGLPPMPSGIPKIEVTFLIDANGILNVSARELRSGQEASIQVVPAHGLTRDEVARIERESIEHAREDMTAHRLIDLRNQVEFDLHKTDLALRRVGDRLPREERLAIEESMRVLRRLAAATGDADRLHEALDAFGRQTVRLAELAVTAALQEARP